MACAAAVTVAVAPAVLAQQQSSRALPAHQGLAMAAPAKRTRLVAASASRVVMSAAPRKQHNEAGLTALALMAAAILPEIAEAAQPGVSPSLKNLLLSVVAGGVVLSAIGVAVAGVSTFDPIKRR